MSGVLEAYEVEDATIHDLQERVIHLNAGERSRLRSIAKVLNNVAPTGFAEPNVWQRHEALLIQLGQQLREYFPDLADDDDESAWKRLAVAYAYGSKEQS